MQWLKWIAIAVIGLLAYNWLRNGLSANASVSARSMPGWGPNMIYGNGTAYTQNPYALGGNYPIWGQSPVQYYKPATPIYVDYTPDSGISFQYGGF